MGKFKIVILSALLLSMMANLAQAAGQNPYCTDFSQIKRIKQTITPRQVDQLLDDKKWVDDIYKKEDIMLGAQQAGKIAIMFLIRRASVVGTLMIATRAETGTVTGSYIRSPVTFAKFLDLPQDRACRVLSIPGREGDTLRDMTRTLRRELQHAVR